MQISILKGSINGTPVYVETHSPSTNDNGLVSLSIGNGTVVSGNFANIDWSDGPYFLKTETDPTNGTNYTISGTSQLQSVPYAQYAKDVENKNDADADPANEIQALNMSNDTLYLSSGNSVYLGDFRDTDWARNGNVVYNNSDSIGIGTSMPDAHLDVDGSFQYTDGNEAQGKFLKSDGSGNASWDSLSQPFTFLETPGVWGTNNVTFGNGDVAVATKNNHIN